MEKWEEIIKQNLKDSKASLPEDDFALFQQKLAGSKKAGNVKKAVVVPFAKVAKIAAPALAACAAVALVVLHPFGVKDRLENDRTMIQSIQPESVVADVLESNELPTGELTLGNEIDSKDPAAVSSSSSSSSSIPSKVRRNNQRVAEVKPLGAEDTNNEVTQSNEESSYAANKDTKPQGVSSEKETTEPSKDQTVDDIIKGNSSNSPYNGLGGYEPMVRDRRHSKTGLAIAGVSGGALTGALAAAVPVAGGILPRSLDAYVPEFDSPMYSYMNPGYMLALDDIAGVYKHVIPMKAGLTARLPILGDLYVMSGLEYSMYYSKIEYTGMDSRNQFAHYVGIPVRLDWSFAKARNFDFYIGAGAQMDFCVAATHDGGKIDKDKPIFSAVGAAGVQYNFSKIMGLYFEPQVCWSPKSDDRALSTYRSEHPVILTGAIGLRFNL